MKEKLYEYCPHNKQRNYSYSPQMKHYPQGQMHKALGLQIMSHIWLVHITYHFTYCEKRGPIAFKPGIKSILGFSNISHLKAPPQQILLSLPGPHTPAYLGDLCLCSSWSHIQARGDVGSSGGPPDPS